MTIGGWILFLIMSFIFVGFGIFVFLNFETACGRISGILIGIILSILLFVGLKWYYANTASGQRALVDQKSELNNGLNRTVTIYTADGKILAQYSGEIDIEGNDGGYVLFDYEGNRYTYYNCFVESIANID